MSWSVEGEAREVNLPSTAALSLTTHLRVHERGF